jgi:hypothetical protein
MAEEHISAVFEHARKGGSHFVVLVTIAKFSDPSGAWIADQASLQRWARLGRRRVQQVLDDLVAAGDIAVTSHHGRGRLSTYRLLLGPKNVQPPAPFPARKRAPECTFSAPPFPPHPQSPLTPKSKKQETFGLPPAAAQGRLFEFEQTAPFSPLPFGEGGSGTHGRGAGGEGPGGGKHVPRGEGAFGGEGRPARPLSASQSAVAQVNRLLQSAAVPLPAPSQIGLWSKTLGGIEPLLDLLRRLIANGLAAKRDPIVYIHSSVTQSAARPHPANQPARFPARTPSKPCNVCLYAGADERRIAQAARIAAFRGHW